MHQKQDKSLIRRTAHYFLIDLQVQYTLTIFTAALLLAIYQNQFDARIGIGISIICECIRGVQIICGGYNYYYVLEQVMSVLGKVTAIVLISTGSQRLSLIIIFAILEFIMRLLIQQKLPQVQFFDMLLQIAILIIKLVITSEVLLICMKLDGYLSWDWLQLMWPLMLLIIANGIFAIVMLASFLLIAIFRFLLQQHVYTEKVIFYLLLMFLEETIFLGVYLIYTTRNSTDKSFYYFAIAHVVGFSLFTCCAQNQLLKYLIYKFSDEDSPIQEDVRKKRKTEQIVLKQVSENFFRPMSSTSQRPLFTELQCTGPVQLMDVKFCVICQDGKPDRVFMPCGHGGFCKKCVAGQQQCFFCRESIHETLKTERQNGGIVVI